MVTLRTYLERLQAIHSTGEAVPETSYYGQLEALLNDVGNKLSPAVTCVLTTKNRGAGIPDGGLFVARQAVSEAGDTALFSRAPERGVMEVKGAAQDVVRVARSGQVRRYLERYGKVLVCTYRDFLVVGLDSNGEPQTGERFTLASDEDSFWALDPKEAEQARGASFADYLKRALQGDAPLSAPADVAWFLAAYARTGLTRVEEVGDVDALATLRSAMEEALGLRFEGEDGDHFFRSALVQTLFYGVFASWAFWSERQSEQSTNRFTWRQAQWTLSVPMVRVLFQQLATPTNLPAGLDEVLDWTDEVLSRVDRKLFFQRFEAAEAVQYFYEPFLQAYDPELRRELGVWYTPPEVVHYMVDRVHQALQTQMGLPLGLADPSVHVLDPCTGTGSYLTAVLDKIVTTLRAQGDDGLVAAEVKQAALSRIHGFELLPAPFVIAHLKIGIALQRLGVPLDAKTGERASVYLTNALTGWVENGNHPTLPFPEFTAEREAAHAIKRDQRILVVLGNPPYNGFAGVSGNEEGGLVEPYKVGLTKRWDVTKNKLDDLYVRFFRVAERRIAEQTGKGIICFVSNSSWLGDPSSVVMRERLLAKFDDITIDHLNGDSRETGKKTPDGEPDPSIFSTRLNPAGITRGVAIGMLVRATDHDDASAVVRYRDFWGQDKREQLTAVTSDPDVGPRYETLTPDQSNWFRLLRWTPRQGYADWPAVNELCAEDPMLGLNENRQFALIDNDREALAARMRTYLDPNVPLSQIDPRLASKFSRFDPEKVRKRLMEQRPFDEQCIQRFQFRPLDMRYAYVETEAKLWNESRSTLVAAAETASRFLLVRRRAPRALDGAAVHLSDCLVDQKVLFTDAYAIPFWLSAGPVKVDDGPPALFDLDAEKSVVDWRPNLSDWAMGYLKRLGIDDAEENKDSASLVWLHALAIGFSPLYVEQNGEAVRSAWPRIPFPNTKEKLYESAVLGERVAALLNPDAVVAATHPRDSYLRTVAAIERTDGNPLNPGNGDLAVTAGWGIVQPGKVMPGAGKYDLRERAASDTDGLTNEERDVLGEQVLDIYLNDDVRWRGVPGAAWDFKIGGFQVLRKWLSYRDKRALGRDLIAAEARTFTTLARRLTALALLGPELDASYVEIVESAHPARPDDES
ncbi:type ISP restriction/modification enzyme [Streptomyces xanthophaeus]|uniref:type ISP restriction/modification enzyme n=1 Tax=Streptomyces xanthophaeus TaxID=67385 RepID=UPI002649D946|nr:type ISP restriction/modification enzyme [Streptomyces xanthophaeus]WKD32590.1 N-6 DNA methylase [Streptomyces xanthophaeus]